MNQGITIILEFMRSQPLATIATVAPGALQPESALIAFAQTDDLEIIFESFVDTRKWRNLQQNPHVAFVMGWGAKRHLTLQYEGQATAIAASEIEAYKRIFLAKKTPCTAAFLHDPRVRLFKTSPRGYDIRTTLAKHPILSKRRLMLTGLSIT